MASKKTSTRALKGPRQMVLQFESAGMDWAGGVSPRYWQPTPSTNVGSFANWLTVGNNMPAFYNESYLDLSGYERDDLTTVVRSVRVQDPGVYMFQGTDQVFCVYDLLTTERLTSADLVELANNNRSNRQTGPGMPEGPLDRDQIIFGLYRFFSHNNTNEGLPTLMLNSRTCRFGSGEPTAVQKLWAYRIVIFFDDPDDGQSCFIPATNFVVNSQIIEESEIPYLMRLKRSYELSQRD